MRIVLARAALRGAINGASETVVTYATHLRRSGHDVSVLALYPPRRSDPYWRRLRRAGVPVEWTAAVDVEAIVLGAGAATDRYRRSRVVAPPVSVVGQSLLKTMACRCGRECENRLRRSGADIVHVVGQDAGTEVFISAAHAAGIPTLFQELGAGTQPSDLAGLPSALRLCSEVAALSPRIADRVGDALSFRGPVSVLPIITEPPEDSPAARPPSTQVTFGFAGRLYGPKGALETVEALARARAAVPGIKLRITGAGPEERRLRTRAQALGVADACEHPARYADPVERTSFMRGLDVFVLPSLTEGTPNGIVEAMAHGVPVLSTEVGGIPDVVTPEVGVLVPPGDVDALAGAMTRLAEDPAQRALMARAAMERYTRLFAPAAVLPVLVETYHRVAGASARPGVASRHDWARCGDGR